MRTLTVVALAFLLAGTLCAQRHSTVGSTSGFGNVVFPGTGHAPTNPNVSGFGNVVFPGTGGPPRTAPFSITNPGFARGLANTVSGRVPYGHGQQRGREDRRRSSYVYVPYAYPVYTGGYGSARSVCRPPAGPRGRLPAAPAAAVAAGGHLPELRPAEPETPDVQVYRAPERSQEEIDAAADQASQPYYLIAFNDHSIYSAVAYWIDGDTLHYFTSGNVHNQVSMALVDKQLTERLNKERHVDVRLPK